MNIVGMDLDVESTISSSVNSLRSSVDEDKNISKTELNSKWLHAHYDPLSTLYTFSSCMCLADLNGDGDNKLIIADLGTGTYNMKLKVYKGTSLQSEHTVIDLPTGVVSFHMGNGDTRTLALAVASGSNVFIYKNMRPFYKFTLPSLEVNQAEADVWSQTKDDKIDVLSLREVLENIRAEIGQSNLTTRSQRFLMLNQEDLEDFAQSHKSYPLKRQTIITCLTTMKKSMTEEDAISCLVLGTESRHVYVLEPNAFTILAAVTVPSVPVFLDVSGLFDVEYRIIVACRNGCLYTIKRGFKTAQLCVELGSQLVGLLRVNNNIVVACMDQTFNCYSTKGRLLWSLKLQSNILAIAPADITHLGLRLVIVALSNGIVHLYQDKCLVDILPVEDVVTAIRFGRFGREDNTLIIVTRGGGLIIKILKRTAVIDTDDLARMASAPRNLKLNIPKKTKLFVDQTMRERENSVDHVAITALWKFFSVMHRTFQHDLFKLRLHTARAFVKALTHIENPVSFNSRDLLKLSAQVQGLGPIFLLHLELQNTSASNPSVNLFLCFNTNSRIYKIQRSFIPVPFLAPGLLYTYITRVDYVSDLNIADVIKVYVVRQGEAIPLLTAVITMPVSEGMLPQ